MLLHTTSLTLTQKTQISNILNNEYPKSLNFSDANGFNDYLTTLSQPIHYLIENENGKILGWACKFNRDKEKWFAIILDEKIQKEGKGTELLNAIKENETTLNAWVIDIEGAIRQNGEIYKSPLNFYLKNGFVVYPEIRLGNDKISAAKIIWKK